MEILILEFFNLFCAGILAGIEIAVHYGFHKPTLALDEKPQIVLRQGVTRTLRWLVPDSLCTYDHFGDRHHHHCLG